jgi:hypothetical protein
MIARSLAFAAAVLITAGSAAFALDHSAKDTAPRGPVELCCVNVALLPTLETSDAPDRRAPLDPSQTGPASEAKPGLEGADWNCQRPDGSRRCFSSLRDQ